MAFEGFTYEARDFFFDIAMHNNKEFFDANRKRYIDHARTPMRALAAAVADAVLDVDDTLDTRPERAVSRIRRDTRFTKDKTPYRDHLWASYRHSDESVSQGLNLYFEVSGVDVAYGMGFYSATPTQMRKFRAAVMKHQKQFLKIIEAEDLMDTYTLLGHDYVRLPAECESADPRLLPWLCKKSFYLEHVEGFESALDPILAKQMSHDFRLLAPLYHFIDDAMKKA